MNPSFAYCAPFFIAALLIFIVFLYTCRRLEARGAGYLAGVCLAASVWASTEGMLYLGLSTDANILVTKCQYFGIAPVPPLALLFGLSFFDYRFGARRMLRVSLLIMALLVIALVWTNPLHRLFYTHYHAIRNGPIPMLGVQHGPLWWGMIGYHYFLVALLSALLLQKVLDSSGSRRAQAGLILASVAFVWAANIVFVSGNSPIPNMDISPVAFTLVAGAMAWGFFRHNLLDILPVAKTEIFRGLDDAILVFDAEDRVIDVNPAAEAVFGIEGSKGAGKAAQQVFARHPKLLEMIAEKKPGEVHLGIDAREHVYDVRISPLNTGNRSDLGSVVVLRDITERKRAEESMQESEERYRQIFNIAPAAIYEVDYRTGKLINANDAMCEYTGYTKAELLSLNTMDFLTEESRVRFLERLDRIFKGEKVPKTVEYTARKKDGSEFMLSINTRFVYEGEEIVGATVAAQDITEIRKSEKRYKDLFQSISDLIFTLDADGRFLTVNPALTEAFGYTEAELIGHSPADFMKPDFRSLFEEEFLNAIKADGDAKGISIYYTKSGGKIYIEYHCSLVTPSGGDPYISGTGRNVTERVLSERQIKNLQEELFQTQKMEAIGTLAGGIAHDFNNLMMGIQGRTSLMLMDRDVSRSDHEHLKGIEEYVKSATDLTRQLLGFAKGGKYEAKSTDLNDLLESSSRMFGRTRKEIEIHRKYQEGIWAVEADRGQINQVLMNLFINAWQAMPEGGDLYLKTENVLLEDSDMRALGLRSRKCVKASITDTGVGMDEATQKKIFEPFFTTKMMGRGTGLGLASVYGIVKNHEGTIRVNSRKGAGAAFHIYLPASGKKIPPEVSPERDVLKGSERILLVDDEEMILQVVTQQIETLGYTVLTASNGEEAISAFSSKKDEIDLVILDMIMPGMGGGEVYDELKAMDPDIKVVLSSGYSLDGQADEILRRGCNGFLQKPFNMQQLSKKLREILDPNPA